MSAVKIVVIFAIIAGVNCSSDYYRYNLFGSNSSSNGVTNVSGSVTVRSHVINRISFMPNKRKSLNNYPFSITVKSPELKISTVSSGVPLPPSKRRSKVGVSPIERNCKSQEFKDGLKSLQSKVKCKPRPRIIYLESTSKSTLIPNAVLAKLCDGSCTASHKCVPTNITTKTYYVREIKLNTVYCTSVQIEEHLGCKCDCPKKATECNVNQEYDKETCTCNCKNKHDFNKCLQRKNVKWSWNEEECACVCVEIKYCTTGTVWNPYQCKCVSTDT